MAVEWLVQHRLARPRLILPRLHVQRRRAARDHHWAGDDLERELAPLGLRIKAMDSDGGWQGGRQVAPLGLRIETLGRVAGGRQAAIGLDRALGRRHIAVVLLGRRHIAVVLLGRRHIAAVLLGRRCIAVVLWLALLRLPPHMACVLFRRPSAGNCFFRSVCDQLEVGAGGHVAGTPARLPMHGCVRAGSWPLAFTAVPPELCASCDIAGGAGPLHGTTRCPPPPCSPTSVAAAVLYVRCRVTAATTWRCAAG